jgi:hypothetical protein
MRFVPQTQNFYPQEASDSGFFLASITETFIYSLLHPEERDENMEPWDFSQLGGPPPDSRELQRLMFHAFKEANHSWRGSRFPVVMYPLRYLSVMAEICQARQSQPS